VSVVGTATTVEEALRRAIELDPDVVLLDVHFGVENGFDLVQRMEEAGVPASRMILTSTIPAEDFPEQINTTRAAGFIPKAELSAGVVREVLGSTPGASDSGSNDCQGT
jgi:DNA-binding NarL/FixJ family response regulator